MFLLFLYLLSIPELVGPKDVSFSNRILHQYHCEAFVPQMITPTPTRRLSSASPERSPSRNVLPVKMLSLVTPNDNQDSEKKVAEQYMETLSKVTIRSKKAEETDIGKEIYIVAQAGGNLFRVRDAQGRYFKLLVNNAKTNDERNTFIHVLLRAYKETFEKQTERSPLGSVEKTIAVGTWNRQIAVASAAVLAMVTWCCMSPSSSPIGGKKAQPEILPTPPTAFKQSNEQPVCFTNKTPALTLTQYFWGVVPLKPILAESSDVCARDGVWMNPACPAQLPASEKPDFSCEQHLGNPDPQQCPIHSNPKQDHVSREPTGVSCANCTCDLKQPKSSKRQVLPASSSTLPITDNSWRLWFTGWITNWWSWFFALFMNSQTGTSRLI